MRKFAQPACYVLGILAQESGLEHLLETGLRSLTNSAAGQKLTSVANAVRRLGRVPD